MQEVLITLITKKVVFLVCFDSLRLSQQFFSQDGTGLPGLNQYKAEDILCLA